ncbi:MAG: serine O-acetyltransferase [Armatimonadota bacterium]
MLFNKIWQDIQAAQERDPAARSIVEILLCYSGLHAIIGHRINHRLWVGGLRLLARFNSQVMKFLTGIEIHPGATIGDGFFIDHGAGIVIGETAEIGDGCTLFQGVTLGGTGKESGKRHPTLCDDVTVGAHAQVLGSIRVGKGAVIGAGAVVLDPVPDYATVVGHKAYVLRRNGERVYDFHHENLPRIGAATEKLIKRVQRLEEELNLPPLEPEQPHCDTGDDTAEQPQDISQHTDDSDSV